MKAKKLLIGVICLNLCLTAAACGSKQEKEDSSKKESSSVTETTTKADETPESTADSEEEKTVAEEYNTEKTFWKANIPETLKENEDYVSEGSDYSSHTYEYLNGDTAERSVSIRIYTEDSLDFRQSLIACGVSLTDYADGNVETITLGDYDFVKAEYEYWGSTVTTLMARDPGSQISITISVSGDYESEDIQTVINSIVFTLPEGSETDAPYPWEGEPINAETGTADVGGYSITAVQVKASESILPNDIFDNRVVVADNMMYALSDQHLYIFDLDGDSATLRDTIELEGDYENLNADSSGNVYISSFMSPLLVFREGSQSDAPDVDNQIAVSRDGSFGIEFFTTPDDVNKITFKKDGTAKSELMPLDEEVISMINEVFITEDYILVSGSAADDSGHKLFVFDHDGKYLNTLGDENGESLGSITGAVQTENGILALDGNMRTVILWDKDGKYVGEADDSVLFGTDYPWMSGLYKTDDGKIYVSMVEERPDKSWDEMIMFRLESDF